MGQRDIYCNCTVKYLVLTICAAVSLNAAPFEKLTDADAERIANAIYVIEGGNKTKFPYGIKSIDTKGDVVVARKICLNTIRNNHKRWLKANKNGSFINFLANRYCPASVDPKGNRNWKANIARRLK